MADIGKPVRKYRSIPLEEDVPAGIEPRTVPAPVRAPEAAPSVPQPVKVPEGV